MSAIELNDREYYYLTWCWRIVKDEKVPDHCLDVPFQGDV
jgi:hypothetical protein